MSPSHNVNKEGFAPLVEFCVFGDPKNKGKVTGKGRPRFTRTGRVYTPAKTVRMEKLVAEAARAAFREKPWSIPLHVTIRVLIATKTKNLVGCDKPTRPDLDNYVKAILDGMNGVVYLDDAQVVSLEATKHYCEASSGDRIFVEVWD